MAFGPNPGQPQPPGGQFQAPPPYAPPAAAPAAPPQAPRAPGAGGLAGFGALLAVYVLLQLVQLILSVAKAGPALIPALFGIGDRFAAAPFGFYTSDLALALALGGCAVGAFTGRRWARPAAIPLLAVFGYANLTALLSDFTASDLQGNFTQGSFIAFNAVGVLQPLVGVAAIVVGALTSRPTTAAGPGAAATGPFGGQSVPQQGVPQHYAPPQAPQFAPQQPRQPYPPQQAGPGYGYGYPQPPAGPPTA